MYRKSIRVSAVAVVMMNALLWAMPRHVSAAPILEVRSPFSLAFVQGLDFLRMAHSPTADVTARVQGIDLFSGTTSGCDPADFAGFAPGRIALIERETCSSLDKAYNAMAAGAAGVLIFNNVPGVFADTLGAGYVGTIPVFSLSQEAGMLLRPYVGEGLTMHMAWDGVIGSDTSGTDTTGTDTTGSVAEPASLSLLGIGLVALVRRKVRSI